MVTKSTGETADTISINVEVPAKTSISTAPIAGNISVMNYTVTGTDSVTVTGLASGDVVKVYTASVGGSALAGSSGGVVGGALTITLTADLGTSAGSVWVTVTNVGKAESTPRVQATYLEANNDFADLLLAWDQIDVYWNDGERTSPVVPSRPMNLNMATDVNVLDMARSKVSVSGVTMTVTSYFSGVLSTGVIDYTSSQKLGVVQFVLRKGESMLIKQVYVVLPAI
jgi:hypothetical protein